MMHDDRFLGRKAQRKRRIHFGRKPARTTARLIIIHNAEGVIGEMEMEMETAPGAGGVNTQRDKSCHRQGRLGLVLHHPASSKSLRRKERSAAKRAYVHFTGAQKRGPVTFVQCPGYTSFNTMEVSL